MQQEDDLRGLAKVMEFMRAISILLVIIHIYWFFLPLISILGGQHLMDSHEKQT